MIVYCVNDGAVMKAWEKDQFKEAGIKGTDEVGLSVFPSETVEPPAWWCLVL